MKRIVTLSLLCLLVSLPCWADFNLYITPQEATRDLNFVVKPGRIETKEVEVRVTSNFTTSDKYQLRQQLLERLTNERGDMLDPEAIKFYPLRKTETRGSFEREDPLALDALDRVIYHSTAPSSGVNDLFFLIFDVDESKVSAPGRFRGRMRYTLVPLEGSGTEQYKFLDILVDVQKDFRVEVTTSSHSSRVLELSSSDGDKPIRGYASLDIRGTLYDKFQIYQILDRPFEGDTGGLVDIQEAVKFSLRVEKGQTQYSSGTPLKFGEYTEIYTSNDQGQGEEVLINFIVDRNKLKAIPAGIYQSILKYQVKSQGGIVDEKRVELKIEVTSVFELDISYGPESGLYFRNLKPGRSSVDKEVVIKVNSNRNRSYEVIQILNAPFTTKEGHQIPLEHFTLRQEIEDDQLGEIKFERSASLEKGTTSIFSSDPQGTPAEFTTIYCLTVPWDMKAGDYVTKMSYSLMEK